MHAYITNLSYTWLQMTLRCNGFHRASSHHEAWLSTQSPRSCRLHRSTHDMIASRFPHELDRSEDSTWQGGPGHIYTACFAVVDTLGRFLQWSIGALPSLTFPPLFVSLLAISIYSVGSHVLFPCVHRSPHNRYRWSGLCRGSSHLLLVF